MDTVTRYARAGRSATMKSGPLRGEIIADILWDAAQAPTTPVSGPFLFHVIEGATHIAAIGEQVKQYAREHRPR